MFICKYMYNALSKASISFKSEVSYVLRGYKIIYNFWFIESVFLENLGNKMIKLMVIFAYKMLSRDTNCFILVSSKKKSPCLAVSRPDKTMGTKYMYW